MKLTFTLDSRDYTIDSGLYHDISIPMDFHGKQPRAFGVDRARAKSYVSGSFVGDTRLGGSCNFEQVSLVPHCNGTHTEGIGHLSHDRNPVLAALQTAWMPATLVSLNPERAGQAEERYDPQSEHDDLMISRRLLREALKNSDTEFMQALVIRTQPNGLDKIQRDYTELNPAYFSIDAMELLEEIGVRHLLVDLPSVDRSRDQGRMSAHRVFWGLGPGSHDPGLSSGWSKTITEFIYVPDQVPDGRYLLNLQIAPFVSDASPSRPLLFPLNQSTI